MVAHETQRFILVRGMVRAKPYSSGAAALVFVCSITGAVAPSYEVDGIGGRWMHIAPKSGSLKGSSTVSSTTTLLGHVRTCSDKLKTALHNGYKALRG